MLAWLTADLNHGERGGWHDFSYALIHGREKGGEREIVIKSAPSLAGGYYPTTKRQGGHRKLQTQSFANYILHSSTLFMISKRDLFLWKSHMMVLNTKPDDGFYLCNF